MRNRTRCVALILMLLSAHANGQIAGQKHEVWQQSWEQFIDAYNACTKMSGCDPRRFSDKVVSWKGTRDAVTCKPDSVEIRVSVTPQTLLGPDGKPRKNTPRLKHIDLSVPDPTRCEAWQNIPSGSAMTFEGRTRTGSVIAFSDVSGRTVLSLSLRDINLLDLQLPEHTSSKPSSVDSEVDLSGAWEINGERWDLKSVVDETVEKLRYCGRSSTQQVCAWVEQSEFHVITSIDAGMLVPTLFCVAPYKQDLVELKGQCTFGAARKATPRGLTAKRISKQ